MLSFFVGGKGSVFKLYIKLLLHYPLRKNVNEHAKNSSCELSETIIQLYCGSTRFAFPVITHLTY